MNTNFPDQFGYRGITNFSNSLLETFKKAVARYGKDDVCLSRTNILTKRVESDLCSLWATTNNLSDFWEVYREIQDEDRVGWKPIETAPTTGKTQKFIVTNNRKAVDANGNLSHIWLVSMVHLNRGEYVAFSDCGQQINYLTHWMELKF